jgi:hypothetical protein
MGSELATNSAEDPERAGRLAWISQVRGLHRNKRMLGFAGIIAGAGVLLWWKFTPAAPDWALWSGGGVLFASWLLLIFVIIDRYSWVKKNPYRSQAE